VAVGPASAGDHSPAGGCRNAAVRVKNLVTPTEANPLHVEQLTVPRAPIGGGGGECDAFQSITMHTSTKVLNGRAWLANCIGALDCVKVADLQHERPTDPGEWFAMQDGDSYSGCTEAHFAYVNKPCNSSSDPIPRVAR
jgi:hypothetical protein